MQSIIIKDAIRFQYYGNIWMLVMALLNFSVLDNECDLFSYVSVIGLLWIVVVAIWLGGKEDHRTHRLPLWINVLFGTLYHIVILFGLGDTLMYRWGLILTLGIVLIIETAHSPKKKRISDRQMNDIYSFEQVYLALYYILFFLNT